jgi:hypothetical protein
MTSELKLLGAAMVSVRPAGSASASPGSTPAGPHANAERGKPRFQSTRVFCHSQTDRLLCHPVQQGAHTCIHDTHIHKLTYSTYIYDTQNCIHKFELLF